MNLESFKIFGEALAIGLLIGSERYRDLEEGRHRTAGVRTYPIIALLGATAALIDVTAVTVASFLAVAVLMTVGYIRDPRGGFGLTTEMAALFTFWLGYLLRDYQFLAISSCIVVVILLTSKKVMHEFVRHQVSEREFFDTLKFLAVVFIVLPLLPNRDLGPLGFFNPTQVWMLIILVSAISYAGYILVRVLGNQRGLMISSVLGAVVSTTAVTLSLAERAREVSGLSRLCAVAGVLANSIQFPRILFLIWLVDHELGAALAVPLGAMLLVGIAGSFLAAWLTAEGRDSVPVAPVLENPFSLKPVLKFGLLFVGVFFISKVSATWFGDQGILVVSAVAGLGGVSAIGLSLADLVHGGSVSIPVASLAVLLALTTNAAVKWILAFLNGTRELALWLAGGFIAMLGSGALLILWAGL
ncbi:MAG: MgtC/SapB family protein [Acidobacteriota bacterium]